MSRPPLVPWPLHVALEGRTPLPGPLTLSPDDARGVPASTVAWFTPELAHATGRPAARARPGTVVDVAIDPGAVAHLPAADGVEPGPEPVDERYVLVVEPDAVRLRAASRTGVLRGLATLVQLAAEEPGTLPLGRIEDAPRYRWRGLSLDVVRHPFTAAEVRAVVDLLARYKLSVLHLHLTDSQAWRLPVPGRPRLGAGVAFTDDELTGLVGYAAARGVVVLPEADLPGHAAAALAAHPELGPAPPHPVLGHLGAHHDAVPEFVADVVAALADLSPGPFVHVGGDEPFGMPEADYAEVVRGQLDAVHRAGRRAVVWQEAVRGGTLTPDDVLQYWIGPENRLDAAALRARAPADLHPLVDQAVAMFERAPGDVPAAVRAGVPVLVSTSHVLYLDRPYADPADGGAAEERRARVGMRGYPAKTLRDTFDWAPAALPELAGATVAGVEAAVWCETVASFDDLAFLLLPRLAGAAERAWTPQTTPWDDHRARVAPHRALWRRTGWGAAYWPADPHTDEGAPA